MKVFRGEWGLRDMTSNRKQQHGERGDITNGAADTADACTGSCAGAPREGTGKRREGKREGGRVGDSLCEWAKGRYWRGLVVQKVIIILEESLPQSAKKRIPELANYVVLLGCLLHPHIVGPVLHLPLLDNSLF